MLNIDTVTAETLLFEFNTKKSVFIAFGPRIPQSLPLLLLGHKQIEWRDIALVILVSRFCLANILKLIAV